MKINKKFSFYKNLYYRAPGIDGNPKDKESIVIKEPVIEFGRAFIRRTFWLDLKSEIYQIDIEIGLDKKSSYLILDYKKNYNFRDIYVLTTNALRKAKKKIREVKYEIN